MNLRYLLFALILTFTQVQAEDISWVINDSTRYVCADDCTAISGVPEVLRKGYTVTIKDYDTVPVVEITGPQLQPVATEPCVYDGDEKYTCLLRDGDSSYIGLEEFDPDSPSNNECQLALEQLGLKPGRYGNVYCINYVTDPSATRRGSVVGGNEAGAGGNNSAG